MKDFFKGLAFKVLTAIALVLVGIMIYAASTGGVATIPATVAGAIVTPLQSIASGISNGFHNFIGIFTDSGELKKTNEQLQQQLDEMRQQKVELDELRRQNELFREYLELKEQNPDYKFADAQVIAIDTSDKSGNFTINAGTMSGIKKNDPVITSSGLVGVVYEAAPYWAKVRTILDSTTQVSAMVSRTRERGMTGGSVVLARDGLLRVNMLPRDTGAAAGDFLVTAGVGGIYPANLLIGEITEVHPESDGLSAYATVKPFVDIHEVESVFVIIDFAGKDGASE